MIRECLLKERKIETKIMMHSWVLKSIHRSSVGLLEIGNGYSASKNKSRITKSLSYGSKSVHNAKGYAMLEPAKRNSIAKELEMSTVYVTSERHLTVNSLVSLMLWAPPWTSLLILSLSLRHICKNKTKRGFCLTTSWKKTIKKSLLNPWDFNCRLLQTTVAVPREGNKWQAASLSLDTRQSSGN